MSAFRKIIFLNIFFFFSFVITFSVLMSILLPFFFLLLNFLKILLNLFSGILQRWFVYKYLKKVIKRKYLCNEFA